MSKKQLRRLEREKEFECDSDDEEQVIPTKASAIRKGNILRIRGKPTKVLEMNTSAPGKHGAAKIHFVAIDLSNGKKIEDIHPAHHMVDVLEFKKKDYVISSIVDNEEGEVMILNPTSQGDLKEMKVPRGSNGKGIVEAYDKKSGVVVTVMTIHNSDYVSSFRLDRSRR
mmetsp:Transcript_23377/g.31924  ORF Transcript_23377/g.31924 Transcript_23377/m.31924 type:complete len:169 (-) Transcript_23377:311-817(-)